MRPVNAPTTAQPYTPVLCEGRPLFIFRSATRHPVKPNGGSRLLRFENRVPQTRTDLQTIKTSEDHVPCYQVNLKSTISKHQALKGVEVKTNDELYSSTCCTWVATHFRWLGRSGHGGPPAGNERELPSNTHRQNYPGFTLSTDILAAPPQPNQIATPNSPDTHPATPLTALYKKFFRWRYNWNVTRCRWTSSSTCSEGIWCLHLQNQEEWQ